MGEERGKGVEMPDRTDSGTRDTWWGRVRRKLTEGLNRARAWRLQRAAASRARLAEEMRRMDREEQRLERLLRRLERDDDAAGGAKPPGGRRPGQ